MARYSTKHMAHAVRTKGIKYALVSVFNVVFGQGLLLLFVTVLDWRPVVGNVLAVCISAGPAYVLNRAWVWGKTGKNHLTTEVLPFWGFALAGLVLSTVAVAATRGIDIPLVANIANLTAFGVLWVIKFFFLDAVLFGVHHHLPVDGNGESVEVGQAGQAARHREGS
ncbi:MAG: GtrA family protein [Acidimicrobiales bacterium]|nr:GtrA family protein [Acidimicrobiales bacterium]